MTPPAGRLKSLAGCVLLLSALTVFLSACSPAARYSALSFLFDGVPDPDAPAEAAPAAAPDSASSPETPMRTAAAAPPRRWIHGPYRENRCKACHDVARAFKVTVSPPKLCASCHDDDFSRQRYLHGPVAVGACLVCHHPHDSTHPALLRREVQALCFGCHTRESVLAAAYHRTWEEEGAVGTCLACHDPHGGDNPMFLKRRRE